MRVSFVMPAYNAAPYIAEAIRSVLSQDHPDVELVIVNDGSTDSTQKVIDHFEDDRRIAACWWPENRGQSAAMNRGMELSTGGIILFAAADDIQNPDRASVYEQSLAGTDWGYSGYWHSNVHGQAWEEVHPKPLSPERLKANDAVSGGAIGIRREVFESGIRFREDMRVNEDQAFAFDLLKSGFRYALIDIPTFRYRLLTTGLSYSRKKEVEDSVRSINEEIDLWQRETG